MIIRSDCTRVMARTAPYVALSYIWSKKPQTFLTLLDNINERMQQIDAKNLPKTIMDAVRCTQGLGLKYLWVDSLCIIQDSDTDKAKEIGRMSGIYKNAYATISAAKATKCEDSFLEHGSTVSDLLLSSFKLELLTPKDPVVLNVGLKGIKRNVIFRISCQALNSKPSFRKVPGITLMRGTIRHRQFG
jgi:Heterokaryon incompatibility protein (HET)